MIANGWCQNDYKSEATKVLWSVTDPLTSHFSSINVSTHCLAVGLSFCLVETSDASGAGSAATAAGSSTAAPRTQQATEDPTAAALDRQCKCTAVWPATPCREACTAAVQAAAGATPAAVHAGTAAVQRCTCTSAVQRCSRAVIRAAEGRQQQQQQRHQQHG